MAAQFAAGQIKLEAAESGENITEIQTYLETFNKEIESTDGTTTITAATGTLFTVFFVINTCVYIYVLT